MDWRVTTNEDGTQYILPAGDPISANASWKVIVTAYAIQAAEVLEGEDTDLTDTLTKENLQKIYDIYGKQNNGQTVPEANTNNSKNLEGNDLSV